MPSLDSFSAYQGSSIIALALHAARLWLLAAVPDDVAHLDLGLRGIGVEDEALQSALIIRPWLPEDATHGAGVTASATGTPITK